MANTIKVYATAERYLKLSHSLSGPLRKEGSLWLEDGETCRMIVEGAITTEAPQEAKVSEQAEEE